MTTTLPTETVAQAIDRVLSQWEGTTIDIPDLRKCLLDVLERPITSDTAQTTGQIDGEVRDLITRSENATRIPHGLDQAISTPDELRQWQTEREQARDSTAQSISKRLAGPAIPVVELSQTTTGKPCFTVGSADRHPLSTDGRLGRDGTLRARLIDDHMNGPAVEVSCPTIAVLDLAGVDKAIAGLQAMRSIMENTGSRTVGPSINTIEREIERTIMQWGDETQYNWMDLNDLVTRLVETYFELQQGRME